MTFYEQAAKILWARIQASESYYWQAGPDEPAVVKVDAKSNLVGAPLMDEERVIQVGDVVDHDWNDTGDNILIRSEAELLRNLEGYLDAEEVFGTPEAFADGE